MMDNYQDSICLALEKALADETVDPINLPFTFLKTITEGFSDNQRIGRGGFASVYKGTLPNGMVAVKRLHNKIEVQDEDFQREVTCLVEVKHKNIVRFLGYCFETQHIRKLYHGRYVWADERYMLFCFEFLSKGSLANYVTGSSSGLQWRLRYQIIKGICEGVAYLHQQQHITHMDLKPDNILLDDSMVPKIADFGLSRRFSENQSKIITENIVGSRGYMAPEFVKGGTITFKADIYSLGVIILEILMGCKECPNVDKVLESWTNMLGTSKSSPLLEQVKQCAEIGIDCMHEDPSKRPDIHDIIHRLNGTDISVQLGRFYQYYQQAKQACKPMPITTSMVLEPRPCWLSESALLDVHPLELCFPFEAKKQELAPLDAGMFEILMISVESKGDLQTLESSIGNDLQKINDDLLKRVEDLHGEVYAAMLTAAVCPPSYVAPKVISRDGFGDKLTIDVHLTQPWILVGHGKLLSIWHYEMEATKVFSLNIKDKAGKLYRMILGHACVTSVRFIPRREWCAAGDYKGCIHIYTCLTMNEIKSFKASGHGSVRSLAIHPTCPYLLSACEDGVIEIWDWEKGWECSRKVERCSRLAHAKFNPMDAASTFVTAHFFDGLKVWSINPSTHQPITKIKCPLLLDHDHVFDEAADRNHVVILNITTDPEIWDLQTGTRVHKLSDHRFCHTAVACHPTLPLIAVGGPLEFYDGDVAPAVCFWNSTNYRLEKTVWCTSSGWITYLGFVGSRRLVIGTKNGIEVLEIDMESLARQQ